MKTNRALHTEKKMGESPTHLCDFTNPTQRMHTVYNSVDKLS